MDAIAGLLDGPRARRAFLLRCTMDPPWALHIRDEAPLSLVAMLRGRACFAFDGAEPQWLDRGDVAIVLGRGRHALQLRRRSAGRARCGRGLPKVPGP